MLKGVGWYGNWLMILISSISGSTDFGNVTHAVPGIQPYFYIGSEALNHTAEYTAASGESEEQLPLSVCDVPH